MKAIVRYVVLIVSVLCLTSCWLAYEEESNDNAELYKSEWSNAKENEGLKFFSDDSVLFFWSSGRASGTFEYSKDYSVILFDGLCATTGGVTSEFTSAQILEDGSMKLIWHELGKSENYYMILYRRR